MPAIPGYDRIGEFRRGGQGVIYKARNCDTGDTVVIKVLIDGMFATDACKARFLREIESIRRVRHPGMVHVLDQGTSCDGRMYYTMEFIDGVPVDAAPPWTGDSIEDGLRLFLRICGAARPPVRHHPSRSQTGQHTRR